MIQFLNQLFKVNTKLKIAIYGQIIILLSSITLPNLSLAQFPRFDAPIPNSSSPENSSSSPLPSNNIKDQPGLLSEPSFVNNSTAPLPEERQAALGVIKPVNGVVNVKLTNKTATTISYEVIGDTTQRQLSGKSEVILMGLKVPINITFYRDKGGFLLIQPEFISNNSLLELTMSETNDFALDKSSLLIEETGSIFLN
ncbi:MAG: hypothetical protein QNJ68_19415 [Microcoleaceae cyanobacterium MO_207.B10]|nr:hypothetical protein [Microcoleaceae cyanobacterium MO_207.B10]